MAQPGRYNLKIYRGDTHHWQFKLWRDGDRTDPVDLENCGVKAQIRNGFNGVRMVEIRLAVTLPNVIDASLDAETSRDITFTEGVWDLQVTYPGLVVSTVLAGSVEITPDVTE